MSSERVCRACHDPDFVETIDLTDEYAARLIGSTEIVLTHEICIHHMSIDKQTATQCRNKLLRNGLNDSWTGPQLAEMYRIIGCRNDLPRQLEAARSIGSPFFVEAIDRVIFMIDLVKDVLDEEIEELRLQASKKHLDVKSFVIANVEEIHHAYGIVLARAIEENNLGAIRWLVGGFDDLALSEYDYQIRNRLSGSFETFLDDMECELSQGKVLDDGVVSILKSNYMLTEFLSNVPGYERLNARANNDETGSFHSTNVAMN